jgi:hypothetical protein
MPLGLNRRPALQAFQPSDLFALFAGNLFQRSDLAEQLNQQSLKHCPAEPGRIGWRRHICQESYRVEPVQGKNPGPLTFLPLLLARVIGAKPLGALARRCPLTGSERRLRQIRIDDSTTGARSLRVDREQLDEMHLLMFQNEKR